MPTAETFYRKMGMIDGGLDAEKENLTYFEWYRRASASIKEYRILPATSETWIYIAVIRIMVRRLA